MTKKFFLTAILTVFGFLQTTHSSWAAGADKPTSKTQAVNPKKEDQPNLSLFVHGLDPIRIKYTDCEGNPQQADVVARNTILKCAKVGTEVYVYAIMESNENMLLMYREGQGKPVINVPAKGLTMDCGGSYYFRTAKCDWSDSFHPQ